MFLVSMFLTLIVSSSLSGLSLFPCVYYPNFSALFSSLAPATTLTGSPCERLLLTLTSSPSSITFPPCVPYFCWSYDAERLLNVCVCVVQVGREGAAHDEAVLRQPAALHPGSPGTPAQVCTVSRSDLHLGSSRKCSR